MVTEFKFLNSNPVLAGQLYSQLQADGKEQSAKMADLEKMFVSEQKERAELQGSALPHVLAEFRLLCEVRVKIWAWACHARK